MSGLREPARQLIGALSGHGGATQSPEPSTAHGAVGEAGLVGQGCPAAGMGAARRSVHEAAHEGLRLQRTVLSNLLAKVRILAALGLSAPKRAEGRGLGTAENSAAGLVLAYLADHRHESGDRRRVFPMTARALTLELMEANRQPDPAQEQDRQRPLPGPGGDHASNPSTASSVRIAASISSRFARRRARVLSKPWGAPFTRRRAGARRPPRPVGNPFAFLTLYA